MVSKTELREVYEGWESSELIRRLRAGGMTTEASEVAAAVLKERGEGWDFAKSSTGPSEEELNLAESKRLLSSWRVLTSGLLFSVALFSPFTSRGLIPRPFGSAGADALVAGLFVVGLSALGVKVAQVMANDILEKRSASIYQKNASLWFLLGSSFLSIFITNAVIGALLA